MFSMKDYQDWVSKSLDYPHKHISTDEARVHFVLGLNGEVGEVTEIIKKKIFGGKTPKEPIIGELGDVLWYLTALCATEGLTLEQVAQHNVEKLKKKYEGNV